MGQATFGVATGANNKRPKASVRRKTSRLEGSCCPLCGKCFTRSHDVKRHLDIHSADKPGSVCKVCDKTFSRPDALGRHQKSKKHF
ncbi:hypothetical protein BC628DRAFT_1334099 [Trametes gibbosa]|uniref:C2H2-type domain-containing protein n=1 Tax=Trametes gibbosa TaxID=160864 RepID=A0A6G6FQE0_9APHY|nr:hypothetical protein BC628DRAFT_1334099 [Trametes gibbosa]QIE48454.1 hypothetical protein [Trametes gibbosa]